MTNMPKTVRKTPKGGDAEGQREYPCNVSHTTPSYAVCVSNRCSRLHVCLYLGILLSYQQTVAAGSGQVVREASSEASSVVLFTGFQLRCHDGFRQHLCTRYKSACYCNTRTDCCCWPSIAIHTAYWCNHILGSTSTGHFWVALSYTYSPTLCCQGQHLYCKLS